MLYVILIYSADLVISSGNDANIPKLMPRKIKTVDKVQKRKSETDRQRERERKIKRGRER